MRAVGFLVLFGIIGLVAGYLIYGKVGDDYIDPIKLFAEKKGVIGYGVERLYGLEKKRNNILVAGGAGAVLGLILGAATGKKKGA